MFRVFTIHDQTFKDALPQTFGRVDPNLFFKQLFSEELIRHYTHNEPPMVTGVL